MQTNLGWWTTMRVSGCRSNTHYKQSMTGDGRWIGYLDVIKVQNCTIWLEKFHFQFFIHSNIQLNPLFFNSLNTSLHWHWYCNI